MFHSRVWLACLVAAGAYSKSTSVSSSLDTATLTSLSGTRVSTEAYTGTQYTYASVGGDQITVSDLYKTTSTTSSSSSSSSSSSKSGTASSTKTGTRTGTDTDTDTATTTTSSTSKGSTSTVTLLVGGGGIVTESIINGTVTLSSHLNSTATTSSSTASKTSTSALPTNTQPCNGYPEFCARQYSNITQVCAHNSAFVVKGNAASNQALSITDQLDDGIRMIQGETHWVNNTIYNCHTSCDLLNAGTWLSELETVAAWVKANPYDVVTILIVNSDYIDVGNYTAPLQASGLGPYLYEPPYIPMRLDQWPTLSDMILSQKRVVVFMDYMANQKKVPYILDEFSHMWETPFSPTNQSFPCTTQRPPSLNQTLAKTELMYLINHNLNVEFNILGESILIPNTAELNVTNSATDEYGALGLAANNCVADWDRPPNWLLVDYYNMGNGSVFEVAAAHNNVTYTGTCCGLEDSAASDVKSSAVALLIAFAAALVFVM